jgi:hypothetical protein
MSGFTVEQVDAELARLVGINQPGRTRDFVRVVRRRQDLCLDIRLRLTRARSISHDKCDHIR